MGASPKDRGLATVVLALMDMAVIMVSSAALDQAGASVLRLCAFEAFTDDVAYAGKLGESRWAASHSWGLLSGGGAVPRGRPRASSLLLTDARS